MQFSTTTLTLFLTALASLSTTQARIGRSLSDNDETCGGQGFPIDESKKHTCPTGRIRCYNEDFGGFCYPRITEEWCNQTCRDYCTDEVPRWVMSVEDCMTNGIDLGTCMYPEGLDLPFPCSGNADD